jgi:hypothetical protein
VKTGRQADPIQVEKDMRNGRDISFSRLAASNRKNIFGLLIEQPEDVECLVEYSEREGLINAMNDEIGLCHPVTYDVYDLCDYYRKSKLTTFNLTVLKCTYSHLEISFKSKDKKINLIEKLKDILSKCECCSQV